MSFSAGGLLHGLRPRQVPIALTAVGRIDPLFEIERDIKCVAAGERLRVLGEQSAPVLTAPEIWLRDQWCRLALGVGRRPDQIYAQALRSVHPIINDGRIYFDQ